MSQVHPPFAVEQAQRRLREVLVELRSAAEAELPPAEYYRLWLTKIGEVTSAARGDALLYQGDNQWNSVHTVGAADADDEASRQRRAAMLQELLRSGRPAVHAGPNLTTIAFPVVAASKLRGAVLLALDIETEAAQQGCQKFVADAADSLERFHVFHDRREALQRAAAVEGERRLSASIHNDLGLTSTAFALANEARLLIGCDRVSVLVRRGRKYRMTAISGQDVVNRRTGAVHSLEDLARRSAASGDTVAFPGTTELSDDLTHRLEDYVDESHAKRLVIAPLAVAVDTAKSDSAPQRVEPLGAVIVEYFGETVPASDELARVETVVRCGAPAIRNAQEHESIFLSSVWQTLGRWRKALVEPGTRRRALVIAGCIVAGLAALVFTPADYTAFTRGTLNPTERRRIFAPVDGTVEKIAVKHGDRVVKGQTLVELRNTDLDIAWADVAGRRTALAEEYTAVERALLDEAKRLTAEERARLSGERSQLREQIASLDRQLALYDDKRKQLVVTSPIDGEVTTWNADDLLENRPVRQGQQLLMVAAVGGPWELELRLPDDRSGRVAEAARDAQEPLRVTFSPAVDPGVIREGKVVEVENSAELYGEEGNAILVRVAINADDLPQRRPGAEVAAHIHCGKRSLGYVWLHDVADFFRSRVLFRWF